jgi:signal transduction histidine kinase
MVGKLLVHGRLQGDEPFDLNEERRLESFAASAASAVATAQTARDEALRRSIRASEEERRRWARELHDQTLQDLAGVRMLLSGAARSQDPAELRDAVRHAVDLLGDGVTNLRSLINDLRPAALDELGLGAALDTLADRVQRVSGVRVELIADLDGRLDPEVESTVYRLVQEALTNVVKHARADRARVAVGTVDAAVAVDVVDDGRGFDPGTDTSGFGLVGMRERLAVVRGTVTIESAPGAGTALHAHIPLPAAHPGRSSLGPTRLRA